MRNPIATAKLHSFRPDLALVSHDGGAPQHALHFRVNDFFRAEVLRIADRHVQKKPNLMTLAFGPRAFEDFPLEEMLKRGHVVGLDIDFDAMRNAKAKLGALSSAFTPLHIDASLFANKFVDTVRNIIFSEPALSDKMAERLVASIDSLKPRKALPLKAGSFDLVVSISTMGSFTAQAVNLLIVKYLWERYGRRAVHDYFSDYVNEGQKRIMKGDLLFRAFARLHRRIAQAHSAEISRLLTRGGVAIVSDHELKASIFNNSGKFSVPAREFSPADGYFENVGLESTDARISFDVGTKNGSLAVKGEDSLESLLGSPMQVLEKASVCNLNLPGEPLLQVPGEYFIDTMLVYRRV